MNTATLAHVRVDYNKKLSKGPLAGMVVTCFVKFPDYCSAVKWKRDVEKNNKCIYNLEIVSVYNKE